MTQNESKEIFILGKIYIVFKNGIVKDKITNKIQKIYFDKKQGYGFYYFSNGRTFDRIKRYKLVAKCFIPNPNKYKYINHKDANKINDKMSNLEWSEIKGYWQINEKNCNWKGDKVGSNSLHRWVKKRFFKDYCDICGISSFWEKIELANKTGIYKRDLKNWFCLCRSCHRKFDKRPSPMKGRTQSYEARKKISEGIKRLWKEKRIATAT